MDKTLGSDLEQRLSEIDEMLLTKGPSALDEALLLVDRKAVYEALHPETTQGGDRKSADFRDTIKTKLISFCSDAAQKLNCTPRMVQMKVAMGQELAPLAEHLRPLPVASNGAALRGFSQLDTSARTVVLGLWAEAPNLSWSKALIQARLRKEADSEETAFARLLDSWTRAGSKSRARFLAEIGCEAAAAKSLVADWRKRGLK